MTLSLCMIVRNEAANLPRCLHSVKDVVDEMVIVDTGSTDETPAIAQSFGAKVHDFVWCNDFSAARNESLKYAIGDWILVLDADEVLVPEVVPTLKQAIQQKNAIVINLVRQEIGAIQSPYSLVSRLFRHHPEVCFSRPYHAMVDDRVAQLLQQESHWQVIDCPSVAILHYGYEPGAIASRNKLDTARSTMEEFLVAHPEDAYVCSKLGALYVEMGEVEKGVELLERGVRSEQKSEGRGQKTAIAAGEAPIRYELYYHLGIAYSRLQKFSQAEQHYRAALQQPILDSLKLGAYNNLGSLLQASGKLQESEAAYRRALAIAPNFAPGYYNLGMTLKAMGKLVEAILLYQKAIAINPDYAEAYQNLGVVLLKLGRVAESLEAFGKAIALHEQSNPARAAQLRQGLQEIGFRI